MAVEEVDFSVIEFNIQVHNLPIEMLTRRNAEVIGNKLVCFIRANEECKRWNMEMLFEDKGRIQGE